MFYFIVYCVPPYYKLVPADSSLCNKRNPTGQSWFTGQSRRHLTHRIWFVIRKQFLNRLINTTFIWSVLSRQSDILTILTPYLIPELDTLSLCDLIYIDIWCLDIRDTLCYSDILTPLKILSCHPVVWYLFGTSYLVTWRDICVTPCDTVSCFVFVFCLCIVFLPLTSAHFGRVLTIQKLLNISRCYQAEFDKTYFSRLRISSPILISTCVTLNISWYLFLSC